MLIRLVESFILSHGINRIINIHNVQGIKLDLKRNYVLQNKILQDVIKTEFSETSTSIICSNEYERVKTEYLKAKLNLLVLKVKFSTMKTLFDTYGNDDSGNSNKNIIETLDSTRRYHEMLKRGINEYKQQMEKDVEYKNALLEYKKLNIQVKERQEWIDSL